MTTVEVLSDCGEVWSDVVCGGSDAPAAAPAAPTALAAPAATAAAAVTAAASSHSGFGVHFILEHICQKGN